CLAFFAREEAPKLVLARENFVPDALQDVMPLLDSAARPRGERLPCRLDRVPGRLRIRAGEEADDVGRVGRIDVLGRLRGSKPLARDEIARCLHCRTLPCAR